MQSIQAMIAHVLARKYDVEMPDIFKTVSRAASDIADSICIPAASEDRRAGLPADSEVHKKPTGDLAAYNEYIQARYQHGQAIGRGFCRGQTAP
ncbi:MAG: hypothetical protein MZU84_01910 [Sphingobacterium sp.]|nr:hypothetical protein [Sphingobacterium sp.]